MIRADQIPDEVYEAASRIEDKNDIGAVILAAINAWPGSYSLAENDSAEIRDVAAFILPLPTENTNV